MGVISGHFRISWLLVEARKVQFQTLWEERAIFKLQGSDSTRVQPKPDRRAHQIPTRFDFARLYN